MSEKKVGDPINTPHINATYGDFAKSVLVPGDPQRSEFIAKEFMTDAKLVNNVRGVQGYTGTYKGKPVSVMASGMGIPSITIYAHELYSQCGVDNIIRVGSCGGYHPDLHLADVVIAQGASTNGAFQQQFLNMGTFSAIADFGLLRKAVEHCENNNINFKVGNILSSDCFYSKLHNWTDWQEMGCLGVEMEAYGLYVTAAANKKKALAVCAVSDSFPHPEEDMSAEERRTQLGKMIVTGLETAISAY